MSLWTRDVSWTRVPPLAPLLLAASVVAQGVTWSQLPAALNPPPRTGQAMAYDGARHEVVLFGGAVNGCVNDTWTWNGAAWTLRLPATSPSARNTHAMAYDRLHGVVVLFGGNSCGSYLNDTWLWNGTDWQQVSPATQPPGRISHGMTFHAATNTCVMFGGWNGARFHDTWEWNGTDWLQRQPATSPPNTLSLPAGAMVYDENRQRSVIAIYYPSTGIETWEWDGANWTLAHSGLMLPGGYQLGFDQARGRTVLMGGTDGYTVVYGQTYEWNGASWSPMSPTVTINRSMHSMVFDEARDQLVTFGGFSILWPSTVLPTTTYAYRSWARAYWTGYGTACAGSLGDLELVPTSRPFLGDTCSVRLDNLPPASLAYLVTGFAQTQQSLASLGLPGCTQLVVVQNLYSLARAGSVATWSIGVPNTTALIGVQFRLQGAALLAGGNNAFGAAFSAGLRGTVGAR